ncbi:MAG: TniQ family protein, partial [Oscillospiraceae bacterium]
SWLARTALLNGRGAWRTLLEESGFGRRIEKPLFDMPDFDSRINNLLNILGCTYEYALLNMSTFRYWASFESSKTEFVKGTSKVKALVNKGKVVSQLGRVGHQFSQSLSLKPYFCSLCLISDLSNFGEPYWHRSHQLPTVYYCTKHHIPLQNKCTNCAISNQRGGKNLMPLPSLICSCGFDYRKPVNNLILSNESYQRLTKISVAALENKEQSWCADNVKAYFKNLTFETLGSKRGQILSKINEVFNAEKISSTRFSIKPPGHFGLELFNRNPITFRALDFCLFLASVNIGFEIASKNFIESHVFTPSLPKLKKVVGVPQSMDLALKALSDRIKHNPSGSPSKYKMLYWYLRLNALDSLKSLIPNMDQKPIPTIEKDRFNIQHLLSKQSKSQYNNTASIVRATIRDSAWLNEKIQQKYKESQTKKRDDQQQKDDKLLEILKQKLHEILDNEERPERITLIRLGTYIGFSASQINDLCKKYPDFNQEVKKVNLDKFRRQLIWAAKELKNEGVVLTAKKIQRKASLPFSPTTNGIVKQLLLEK